MDVRIGQLRERIAIETPTTTTIPSTGEHQRTWTRLVSSLPAKVVTADTDSEVGRAQQAAGKATITIRYRGDVTTAERVVWLGRNWEIESVADPDQRRRWLTLIVHAIR